MSGTRAPDSRVAVVFGGTGLVGGHLVRLLAAEPGVSRVIAPVRRDRADHAPAGVLHPKVDFSNLGESSRELMGDQVFLCLGTTIKKAGSQDAFRAVDFDAVLDAAKVALEAGARDAFLVSSVGADPRGRGFYLRVKGEAEQAIGALAFRSVHVLRPSVLTGARAEVRPGERVGIALGKLMAPFMLGPARRFRPIAAECVARAMVRLSAQPGTSINVHESEEIAVLGA